MAGQKALSGNFYSHEIILKVETAQAQLCQELNQQNNLLPLKPAQPGKLLLTCFWKYSYNTRDCVARETRTFNFGKNCKQYYPLWQKKPLRPRQVIYQ